MDLEPSLNLFLILNVRSGARTTFAKVGIFSKGAEVFIYKQEKGWSKISVDEKWVKDSFLTIIS